MQNSLHNDADLYKSLQSHFLFSPQDDKQTDFKMFISTLDPR